MALHERWKDYTEAEIRETKLENCVSCAYSVKTSTNMSGLGTRSTICDYILQELRIRPCRPEECREKGVWKPK